MVTRSRFAPLVDRLRAVVTRDPSVVSCYLRLDEPARRDRRYLLDIKSRVRDLSAETTGLHVPRAVRLELEADLARLLEWVERPDALPHAPGVALFLCAARDLFEVIPLGRVHRTRVDIDRRPLLHELIGAREALGRYIAVVADRAHARFFDVVATDASELPGLPALTHRGGKFGYDRGDAPGRGERPYHHRIDEVAHRFYERIAAEVTRIDARASYQGVALLGPAEHTAGLRAFLPRPLADKLVGEAPLNPTCATEDQVHSAVWTLQAGLEHRSALTLVQAMEEGIGTGYGVNGARETLRALADGQLRVLLVPAGQRGAGFRCSASGRLVLAKSECRGEGSAEPVPNLVDWAIDAALGRGAEVVVVGDPELGRRIDGLGGTLRFTLQSAAARRRPSSAAVPVQ
ncbi:MAG: hypothetical protein HOP28_04610 [Gemmatimonadales bacterium]|nr:hypothetical protein [Gemmatimonadales bacterium]